jgi:hypothetical protein
MGSVQSINEILNDSMKIKRSLILNDSMNKGWAVEKLCKTSKIPAQEAARILPISITA